MDDHVPAVLPQAEMISGDQARTLPALITVAGNRASIRFLEFFAANIRNPHTRRAYSRAVADFVAWCEGGGVASIAGVRWLHSE
jgi:integrase/recombinase XerC